MGCPVYQLIYFAVTMSDLTKSPSKGSKWYYDSSRIGMLLIARACHLETLQGLKKKGGGGGGGGGGGRSYAFCPILMKKRGRNTTFSSILLKYRSQNMTFSSFLLKYRGRNYTTFPETWKKGGWNGRAYIVTRMEWDHVDEYDTRHTRRDFNRSDNERWVELLWRPTTGTVHKYHQVG